MGNAFPTASVGRACHRADRDVRALPGASRSRRPSRRRALRARHKDEARSCFERLRAISFDPPRDVLWLGLVTSPPRRMRPRRSLLRTDPPRPAQAVPNRVRDSRRGDHGVHRAFPRQAGRDPRPSRRGREALRVRLATHARSEAHCFWPAPSWRTRDASSPAAARATRSGRANCSARPSPRLGSSGFSTSSGAPSSCSARSADRRSANERKNCAAPGGRTFRPPAARAAGRQGGGHERSVRLPVR